MKQELKPNWREDQRAAGERFRQAWDELFSANAPGAGSSEQYLPSGAESTKIADVRSRHEGELLRYPHVVDGGLNAVGLLFAGSPFVTIYNHISDVELSLGVRPVTS